MSGVEPHFQLINAESGQRLKAVEAAVLSLTVEESADNQSDILNLRLDASRLQVLPKSGTLLEVRMGYAGESLYMLGTFRVAEKSLSGPPFTLSIRAFADDFNAPWKEKRTGEWSDTTLGDILLEVAFRNDLSAGIHEQYMYEPVHYLAQTQESDMHLVSRLAERYGAYGTIKRERLFFHPPIVPDQDDIIRLELNALTRFSFNWMDKPRYDTIKANWVDVNSNVSHTVVYDGDGWLAPSPAVSEPGSIPDRAVQSGGAVFELPTRFTSELAAKRALKTKWKSLHRLKAQGRLTLPGRGDLISKRQVEVSGFSEVLDGQRWEILRSRHSFTNSGYVTEVELRAV